MTIRWCAYCQEFLGEKAPFENFDLSHGICRPCAKKGIDLTEEERARSQELFEIQKELLSAGKNEASQEEAVHLVERATAAGVRPIDILMGFVTQLLRHIGKQWELGEATVAEEHRYTLFCERILSLVESILAVKKTSVGTETIKMIIIGAPGNYHTLGVRISALWLNSKGISTKAIYPGLPPEEIPALLREYNPLFLGISVSLTEQAHGVQQILHVIREAKLPSPPEVIIGGFAAKQEIFPEIPGATRVKDLGTILEKLEANKLVKQRT